MKNCKEIENNLSLYLDNLLSRADKLALEEHLKSCPHCSKALAQLQKTGRLVNSLPEVEPPPWFKQKIMAKVREEAEKKSFVQKWFYPLRIKIPVQIFATVFIAVLAVYIYRAGEDQMKSVVPLSVPAPVAEVQENKLPEQNQKAPETVAASVTKEKAGANKGARDERAARYDTSSGAAAPKAEVLKKSLSRENVRVGALDAAGSIKENVVPEAQADKYANAPAAKSVEALSAASEKKKDSYVSASAMKAGGATQVQSLMPKANVALHVADINTAMGEVEKLLAKYGAKNIVRRTLEDKAIVTAELKNQTMKDFIARLKTIGRVEEKIVPVDNADGNISIVIEILNQ
jgi:hypothetical protein